VIFELICLLSVIIIIGGNRKDVSKIYNTQD